MASIREFATWEPLLRLMRAGNAESLDVPGGYVAGQIWKGAWSVPVPRPKPKPGRAGRFEDVREEYEAVGRVRDALPEAGIEGVSFVAEIAADGRAVLHVLDFGPAVEYGFGPYPGSLVLAEGAVPEPWRRLPEPVPGAVPAASADPALLERTLRERLPDAVGADDQEIAAAEARLGVPLPEELKALYRVTRAHRQDWGHGEDSLAASNEVFTAARCELLPLDALYVADAASRPSLWRFAAKEVAVTSPEGAVQGVVGSPGWLVFAGNGGGDGIAVDLTPGPRGHVGQIIMISHEQSVGAELIADSLTDMVLDRSPAEDRSPRRTRVPAVAWVNVRSKPDMEAAVHPGLEVLNVGVREGEPLSLAPVIGLPRLRTLTANPGTLADPLEIAGLTGLEYLELGPEDWRVLLDAKAVPAGLSAATIEARGDRLHPLAAADLADELLALRGRPQITRTTLEGRLGPTS